VLFIYCYLTKNDIEIRSKTIQLSKQTEVTAISIFEMHAFEARHLVSEYEV
jgi:hypothetical protein